jgi:stearoyl-CoA desaturase (delta-9 desaturase)
MYPFVALGGMVALPFVVGAVMAGGVTGGLWCVVWAGLLRVGLLHHMTWSINSLCHCFGNRPFNVRDRSSNVWWLALPSFGESWHNSHHAFPACARHGILRGQLDVTAAVIRLCERARLVRRVRWPTRRMVPHVGRRRPKVPRAVTRTG